jgi:hypothetical protein
MNSFKSVVTIGTVILALGVCTATAGIWEDAQATADVIDRMIGDAQREAGIAPSPSAGDGEFLRRLSLDLTSRVPDAELAESFLASELPEKRRLLIEHLMQSEEYREGQATALTVWLLGRELRQRNVNRTLFRSWIRDEVIGRNMPEDAFARTLITATGRNDENAAVSYLLQFERQREDAASQISRQFLGQQIQCAQCHDHKTEPMSQEQFWAMVAFLGKTTPRPIRSDEGRPVGAELADTRRGRATRVGDTDKTVRPTFLDGETYSDPRLTGRDLRDALASHITDPANPQFARATVNRIWAHFTGRGFVEPVDDFRASNPAQFPGLLDYLADDFRAHGFDREHLMRAIALSETYQRSMAPTDENAGDERLYTHAKPRALTPEQLFWSLMTVTGVEPQGNVGPRRNPVTGMETTTSQRIDRLVLNFSSRLSNDEMSEITEFEGTIPLSLFMMNSQEIARGINPRRGPTLSAILQATQSPGEIVDRVYLAVLNRHSTEEERAIAVSHLRGSSADQAGLGARSEDLVWALLNTSEFMFH